MASDLVSTVSQFLTPDMVQKIAASVGGDGQQVQSAIGAAVPALLAGFAGTATHGGAQKIADAVQQQSTALDDIGGLLGGGQNSLTESGTRLVGSLLGSNAQSGISLAIAKFSGLGQGAATALMGALAPIVLGMIGKQVGPRGIDAASVSNLLESQKSNIAHAMPSRLGNLLEGSGVIENLDAAADQVRGATASATRTASSAASSGTRSASAAVDTGSGMRWLYWLIPLLAILGLLWYFLGRPTQPVTTTTQAPPAATSTNVTTAPNLTIGGIDVGREISTQLGTLRTTMEGVTDAASAQAALPRLESVSTALTPVVSAIGQATTEQKAAVTSMVAPLLQTINPMIDRVMAIPGVSDVLKPTVDTLKTKLTALAS
ncbi:DUF937 domain-containing protein [Devosia sp. ZB163]|uniref:DUF937 domain-containing protein n=1 Tax=Devosia sp. ZB163 TaxID=3025938 RepID=UPI00236035B5|nr:DUF937 domain-containing protein [Devosia sp. ZB163]MDC9822864.1 DUF937 domain-containing protein [Devosia sp. ZB163]